MLKGKIHGAFVTEALLDYEGSIGIDEDLLQQAGIFPGERVHVWNRSNAQRFETYAIVEPRSSGKITVNGAAAHLVKPGDRLIIAAFAWMSEPEAKTYAPKIVIVSSALNQGELKIS